MGTSRLEAFSDAVLAIVITIMVLEFEVPHRSALSALTPLIPIALSYLLSFLYVGMYWNNHHHMLQVTREVDGTILWANLHLLFWLSDVPFVTACKGRHRFRPVPTCAYGVVRLFAAIAYWTLERAILRREARESVLRNAVGHDRKPKVSLAIHTAALPLALAQPWAAAVLYGLVALLWIIPDRRIEHALSTPQPEHRLG